MQVYNESAQNKKQVEIPTRINIERVKNIERKSVSLKSKKEINNDDFSGK